MFYRGTMSVFRTGCGLSTTRLNARVVYESVSILLLYPQVGEANLGLMGFLRGQGMQLAMIEECWYYRREVLRILY